MSMNEFLPNLSDDVWESGDFSVRRSNGSYFYFKKEEICIDIPNRLMRFIDESTIKIEALVRAQHMAGPIIGIKPGEVKPMKDDLYGNSFDRHYFWVMKLSDNYSR